VPECSPLDTGMLAQAEIQQQAEEQAGKAERAKRAVQRAQRLLRGKLALEAGAPPSEQELELQLADVREVNRSVLQELSALSFHHPGELHGALGLHAAAAECGVGCGVGVASAGVMAVHTCAIHVSNTPHAQQRINAEQRKRDRGAHLIAAGAGSGHA
jgi:hypothetical protein